MSNTETQEQVKKPLTDEQVKAVSGGTVDSSIISAWRKIAESEGRNSHIGAYVQGWHNANCPECNAAESLFGRTLHMTKNSAGQVIMYECGDVKCYVCGHLFGDCELVQGNSCVYIRKRVV